MASSSHESQIGRGRGISVQREKCITEIKERKGEEQLSDLGLH